MPFAAAKSMALAPPAANVGLQLLINGYDRTTYLADRSLSIHRGTHGNSLGTLDAQLNDPVPDPAMEDLVVAFAGTMELYEGRVRSLGIDEWKPGTHHFVDLGAQDTGPDLTLPVAAPFGLSDMPNGTTTFGYHSLRKLVRTTEGGSALTSYEVVYHGYGLWRNMNVQVTSAILGLSATELTIVDARVRWPNKNVPEFTFTLGQAQVTLEHLLQELPAVGAGAITQTMIANGAISTPQLNANAVVANLTNLAGNVVINATGITVTSLTGMVIIDGSSDMFRVAATGTTSVTSTAGTWNATSVSLSALGVQTFSLALLAMIAETTTPTDYRTPSSFYTGTAQRFVASVSAGSPTTRVVVGDVYSDSASYLDGSSFPAVRIGLHNASASSKTHYLRYYVLKQTAL